MATKSASKKRCITSSRTSTRRPHPTSTAACTAACAPTPATYMCARTIRDTRRSGSSSCSSRPTNARAGHLLSSIACSASRRRSPSSNSRSGSTCCMTAARFAAAAHSCARWVSISQGWYPWRATACSRPGWSRTNCTKRRNAPRRRQPARDHAGKVRRPCRVDGRRARGRHPDRRRAGGRPRGHVVDRDPEVPAIDGSDREDPERGRRELDVPDRRLRGDELRHAIRQRGLAKRSQHEIIDAAIKIGAKHGLLPECGHAYMALRWMGANMYGKPLPFKVQHISEYLADALNTGKIKVKKVDKSVTYHDPCQVSRRGGATQAAREVLKHLGVDFREMPRRRRLQLVLRRWRRRRDDQACRRAAAQGIQAEDGPGRSRPKPMNCCRAAPTAGRVLMTARSTSAGITRWVA